MSKPYPNIRRHTRLFLSAMLFCVGLGMAACSSKTEVPKKIPIVFDTDANNELDDQHALAYLLLNDETFDILGVTVNATYNGGDIIRHYDEALRVIRLCGNETNFPLLKGANGTFQEIHPGVSTMNYEGSSAVEFIIQTALKYSPKEKLCVLAVGKLTNVALVIKKNPSIIPNIKVVWLGSNYPESGEYNLENDIPAMNFILNSDVEFEMAVCRYGKTTGTDYVKVTKEIMLNEMPGKGPRTIESVIGRHGGSFNTFGDYSVSLFEHCDYYGNPPSRSLFDMAAVAVVKNPEWANKRILPCPVMKNQHWVERPNNPRTIAIWEHFKSEEILNDFYKTFQ